MLAILLLIALLFLSNIVLIVNIYSYLISRLNFRDWSRKLQKRRDLLHKWETSKKKKSSMDLAHKERKKWISFCSWPRVLLARGNKRKLGEPHF